MDKVNTKEIPEIKSLRWLANMFPKVENPQDDSDKLSTCIHIYCTSAADRLEAMAAELAKVRHEKDSIISVLKVRSCDTCKYTECDWCEEPCETCRKDPSFPMWEWRG